jgi:hypothetical protein
MEQGMSKTIKSSNTILLPIVLALLTCTTPTYAKSQGDYKIDKLNYVYDINPDATYSTTTDSVMTVLTESGLSDLNQIDLSYSSSLETVEVVKAYTLKKNGTHIDVPKDNIQDRDVIAGGGPMYSDFKGKVIIFPNLEVGDKIVYTIHSVQKVPMFPKQFSLLSSFSSSVVIDQQQSYLPRSRGWHCKPLPVASPADASPMPMVAHAGSGYGKTQPSPTMKMRSQQMKRRPCRSPALRTLLHWLAPMKHAPTPKRQ